MEGKGMSIVYNIDSGKIGYNIVAYYNIDNTL